MTTTYRDLVVWQKSIDLVLDVYRSTDSFPKHELYGLTSQMRRAAVSIASNIAEGEGRRTDPEFVQFLGNARGSLMELETQIIIAGKLHFVESGADERLLERCAEVGRLINGLIASLKHAAREPTDDWRLVTDDYEHCSGLERQGRADQRRLAWHWRSDGKDVRRGRRKGILQLSEG